MSEKIIHFPNGLPGFDEEKNFKLYQETETDPLIFCLQSANNEHIALSVVEPAVFGFAYDLQLTDEEKAVLKLENTEDLSVLLIVYRGEGEQINANLNGPLLINTKELVGTQKVLRKLGYGITLTEDNA